MLFIKKIVNNLKVLVILFIFIAFFIVTFLRLFSAGNLDFFDSKESLERTWDSVIPCKSELSTGVGFVQYCLTGEFSSVQVLQGEDHWLFYQATNDGDPIADYTGTNCYTNQKKEMIKNTMLEAQKMFHEKGITGCFLVPPNKELVYSRFMPENYKKTAVTRTDELIAYLQKEDISVFNPKETLISYSENYDVFYKYDTHWNELGAYIATQQILESWGIHLDKASKDNIIIGEDVRNDLAQMVGLDMIFNDDSGWTVTNLYDIDWDAFTSEQSTTFSSYYNADAQLDKTLLLVGDSFREAMVPTVCTVFKNVYVVHRNNYNKALLDTCKPDYAIFEYVERYSDAMENPIT